MGHTYHNRGVVYLMVVFVIALLSAVVMGMLQLNTEEIQIMRNHTGAATAQAVAEAGLNDALAQLREDRDWNDGFHNKAFASDGHYTVTVEHDVEGGLLGLPLLGQVVTRIVSVGTSATGFVARIEAGITVSSSGPPYTVVIRDFEVNE